jgi:hypothetical protein
MAAPTVFRVWYNRNRNVLFLIPMIVGIIVVILWSSTFPRALQDAVIVLGVSVAFGVPAALIGWFTVQAWRYSWFVLEAPHLPENVYLPIAGIEESLPVPGSPGRFSTVVHSARELPELLSVFPDILTPDRIKVWSYGELRERVDQSRYGLVYHGGMPAIAHGVEKLRVAPSITTSTGAEEGTYSMIPSFELLSTEIGDYEMLTDPKVQEAMWTAWNGTPSPAAPAPKPSPAKGPGEVLAYCITCRQKREVKDPVPKEVKGGRRGVSGVCPSCGKKLFAITGGKG